VGIGQVDPHFFEDVAYALIQRPSYTRIDLIKTDPSLAAVENLDELRAGGDRGRAMDSIAAPPHAWSQTTNSASSIVIAPCLRQ